MLGGVYKPTYLVPTHTQLTQAHTWQVVKVVKYRKSRKSLWASKWVTRVHFLILPLVDVTSILAILYKCHLHARHRGWHFIKYLA